MFRLLGNGKLFHSSCTILSFYQQCIRVSVSPHTHQHFVLYLRNIYIYTYIYICIIIIVILVGMKWCLAFDLLFPNV